MKITRCPLATDALKNCHTPTSKRSTETSRAATKQESDRLRDQYILKVGTPHCDTLPNPVLPAVVSSPPPLPLKR